MVDVKVHAQRHDVCECACACVCVCVQLQPVSDFTSTGCFHNYPNSSQINWHTHVQLFKVLFWGSHKHTHTCTDAHTHTHTSPIRLRPSLRQLPVIYPFSPSCLTNRLLAIFEAVHGIYKGPMSWTAWYLWAVNETCKHTSTQTDTHANTLAFSSVW